MTEAPAGLPDMYLANALLAEAPQAAGHDERRPERRERALVWRDRTLERPHADFVPPDDAGMEEVLSPALHNHGGVPPPSSSPVDDIARLFELERGRLLDLLGDLHEEDWQRPTPCPGWTVLGLVSHLLGGDLGLLSRRRDNYMGTPPPEGVSEDGFIDWLDALQMEWVRAARRVSPRLVVQLLEWTGPLLVEVLRAEDLSERAGRVSWAGTAPAPRWLDQLRELSEYWIHRQQLREALGRPVDLDPTLLRPILLGLRWALPYRLSQADLPLAGAVQVSIGEPINERWTLVSNSGEWDFADVEPDRVIAEASLTADASWRLLTNNLRDDPRALDVVGDEAAVDVILSTRAIIGRPK